MNALWPIIAAQLLKHSAAYIGVAEALVIAAICSWPKNIPSSLQDWWDWARNTFRTVVPVAHAADAINPQQPEGPAQLKK